MVSEEKKKLPASKIRICPETGNMIVNQGKIVIDNSLYLHIDGILMSKWFEKKHNTLLGDIGFVGTRENGSARSGSVILPIDSRNRGDNAKIRYVPVSGTFSNVASNFSGGTYPFYNVTHNYSDFSVIGITYNRLVYENGSESTKRYFGMFLMDSDGNLNDTGKISRPGIYQFVCFPVYGCNVFEHAHWDEGINYEYYNINCTFKMMPCTNETNQNSLYYGEYVNNKEYKLPYAHDIVSLWSEEHRYWDYKKTKKCYASAKIVINDKMEIESVEWQNIIDEKTDKGLLFGLANSEQTIYRGEHYCDVELWANGVVSFPFTFSLGPKEKEEDQNGN